MSLAKVSLSTAVSAGSRALGAGSAPLVRASPTAAPEATSSPTPPPPPTSDALAGTDR